MAEWWVDPENGLTTNAGTSALVPWKLIPGQTGATAQTGYTVTAGDTINVRNGTTTTLRIVVPANNLTYRGYGLSDNVLSLVLPAGTSKAVVPVYRERGVHEGMWIVDDGQAGTYGMFATSTTSGTVVEDMHLIAPASTTPLSFGTSGSTAIGATVRRSWVHGSAATGIDGYTRQITIEDTRVEDCQDDGITIGASAANGYRAGYTDRLERVSVINVGLNEAGAIGDVFQTFASSNRFESPLIIKDLYGYKPNEVKQAIVVTDMLGGFTLERFYLEGPVDSHCQILLNGLRGRCVIREGYFNGGCVNNPAIRITQDNGVGMAPGSSLTIESVILDAERHAGFFSWTSGIVAYSVDGRVEIRGCYVGGENQNTLSYAGTITAHPSNIVTFGGNQSLVVRNNIVAATGQYAFRLPTGAAGSGLYTFEHNVVSPGLTFAIGSTEYADLAEFEAAHADGDNIQAAPLLDADYRPIPESSPGAGDGSPCIEAGTYIAGARDFAGRKLKRTPDIGARQYYAPHGAVAVPRVPVAVMRGGVSTVRGSRLIFP